MATKSDLQLAAQNWTKRANDATRMGLPASSWQTLMKRDYDQIVQKGSAPMDDKTASDAMLGAIGASPVSTPSVKHGPLDIIGNIPSDIQNFASSIPAGIV